MKYILAFFIVVLAVVYLIIEFQLKKWSCNEGNCEKVIGGDYDSKSDCINSCASKTKTVRFAV